MEQTYPLGPDSHSEEPDTIDRQCVAEGRTSLRRLRLPDAVSDSDEAEYKKEHHLKRRQMRKDLHKLRRCMARTGAAAVAVSMLGGPVDIASMDQASRFRHRPLIPELFPELDDGADGPLAALGLGQTKAALTDYIGSTVIVNKKIPYRDCVLDAGGTTELVSERPSLAPQDWDKLSDLGSEAGGSSIFWDWEVDSELSNSLYTEDFDDKIIPDSECQQDVQLDFVACLDSVSRFRRPQCPARGDRRHLPKATSSVSHVVPGGAYKTAAADFTEAGSSSDQASKDAAGLGAAASGFLLTAKEAVGRCREGLSSLASTLGATPQYLAGNLRSPSGVWSAAQHTFAGNVQDRQAAHGFLCWLGLLIVLVLCSACLVLVVFAFVASPDDMMDDSAPDSQSRPKSISRVLTVIMISVFAGNGLAIAHPMRDALLLSI